MADTKISGLTQLTGAASVATVDEFVLVDKSDTTMAASGTDKRITAADLATNLLAQVPEYADGSQPASPSAGVSLFARVRANRRQPAFVGPSGLDSILQPSVAHNCVSWVRPNGNSTTLSQMGLALTATGTATAKNIASTNLNTSMRGMDYLVTSASTTAVAGWRGNASQFWFGNAAGLGGFFFACRWAPATGQATTTSRAFCGLKSSTSAPTDAQPSAGTNILGMGWDAADTNAQFMCNDGSGTATKVDLGGSFAVPTTNYPTVYELCMFVAPNTSTVYWEVRDLATGAVATGTATTDLPSNTTFLNPWAYCSVGGTSSVIGITLFGLYIETDN